MLGKMDINSQFSLYFLSEHARQVPYHMQRVLFVLSVFETVWLNCAACLKFSIPLPQPLKELRFYQSHKVAFKFVSRSINTLRF